MGWGGSLTERHRSRLHRPPPPTSTTSRPGCGSCALASTQVGLLLLIATPVVRVAVSAFGFMLERDRIYVAITLAVLLILLASLFVIR